MKPYAPSRWAVLMCLVALAPAAAPAGDGAAELPGCDQVRVDLGGSEFYHSLRPSKGLLVLIKPNPSSADDADYEMVTVFDQEGQQVFECAPFLDIPEMSSGRLLGADLRTPGRLVVSTIRGSTETHWTPVLAEYDVATGQLLQVASTGSIVCGDLVGDDRGVTWCLGHDASARKAGADYDMVYRFDHAGNLLGSALPRSTYPSREDAADPGMAFLRGVGSVGTGFLPGEGGVRLLIEEAGELVSFDRDGAVRERLALPEVENLLGAQLVTAGDDEVFAMLMVGDAEEPDEWTQGPYRLAEDGSAWLPLQGFPRPVPRSIALVGGDQERLLLLDRRTRGLCRLPITGEPVAHQ